MFQKILIANRGEIALRILRACRELGVPSVIAYSEADRESLPVLLADEAICIGPAPAARSYNSISAVISAATITGCDALHPGYGFLAENASLAEICRDCGITFIGPRPEVMQEMSDKATARRIMHRHGLPIVPGTENPVHDAQKAAEEARRIGYPLVIKAVAGGGGRGMRVARDERELIRLLPLAQSEAQAAFGDRGVYLERFLDNPRHIEVQLLADEHDHVLSLGERDCSLQRRYQKLVEESPAPNISKRLRDNLAKAAVKGARSINYTGAGTVEFLVDSDGRHYFTEMNTRIQVEHPVTEIVTGVDLVQWQIRIAAGVKLDFSQKQIEYRGHALEVRINAEDGTRDFAPSGGVIERLVLPGGPGVRVDSHLYQGYRVPTSYDSLLGKLIVWDDTRELAIARMRRALSETLIEGVPTTVPFYQHLMRDQKFIGGEVSTHFIPEFLQRSGAGLRRETLARPGPEDALV